MFNRISKTENDAIEALYERSGSDTRPEALNLGIGVYRNADGEVPIFEAVKQAEIRIANQNATKGYMTPLGNERYLRAIEKLVLGEDHLVLQNQRLVSAQSPGAGGALRLGAEISKKLSPGAVAWFSDPVWEHQIGFFSEAGLETRSYAYYDKSTQSIDFDGMLNSLEQAKAHDLIVIHGCCHNPTGADLSLDQWTRLSDFLKARKLIPFVDIAYQGYGTSIEEDVAGARLMAEQMDNMMIAISSSKSFSMYRDRAGLFGIIFPQAEVEKDSAEKFVRDAIRGTYFMPPDHAAAVIGEVLKDEALFASWEKEISEVRSQINTCRHALTSALSDICPDMPSQYLREQKGMFSCIDFDEKQLAKLEEEFAIYLLPGGRINFAAMQPEQAERIANAFCHIYNAC